jgi:hypothetical protein
MVDEIPVSTMIWECAAVVHGIDVDRAIASVVLLPGEFGRGRDLPTNRIAEIDAVCVQHWMVRYQALSLRRQLLRAEPGGMKRVGQSHNMGNQKGQQQHARNFELAVENYIHQQNVSFISEKDQITAIRSGLRSKQPTPDILFTSPTSINGRMCAWLDCKAYYGTSLLMHNKNIPVGRLSADVEKYTREFGHGGFVFGQGFNTDLQSFLGPTVTLLDATPLDMSDVEYFQDQQT